jgi:very-short-patch-repair endonuclease
VSATLRSCTTRARALRRNSTNAKHRLWYALRDKCPQWKFRRQHPIGRFVVDFAYPAAKLAIELDGGQHASSHKKDEARTSALAKNGYRVIRFWNTDVLKNTDGVIDYIVRALTDTHLTPTLSALKGGVESNLCPLS